MIPGLRIDTMTFPRDLLPEENFESSKRPYNLCMNSVFTKSCLPREVCSPPQAMDRYLPMLLDMVSLLPTKVALRHA